MRWERKSLRSTTTPAEQVVEAVTERRFFSSSFPPPLHFNVLMQPKAMKHSIPSTYIDTPRVVLTMYVHSMEKLSA